MTMGWITIDKNLVTIVPMQQISAIALYLELKRVLLTRFYLYFANGHRVNYNQPLYCLRPNSFNSTLLYVHFSVFFQRKSTDDVQFQN